MFRPSIRRLTLRLLFPALAALLAAPAMAAEHPKEIRLDYAYYSPTSLVLKHFGWAEQVYGPRRRGREMGAQHRLQSRAGIPRQQQPGLRLHGWTGIGS